MVNNKNKSQDQFNQYQKLNQDNIIKYLDKVQSNHQTDNNAFRNSINIKKIDLKTANVLPIDDGNLNQVFRIVDKNNNSIVLKQSLPYIKCLGEDYPLGKERILYEVTTYKALQEISNQLSSDIVPEIYHTDDEMCLIILEDLKNHKLLRSELISGEHHREYYPIIAEFLGMTASRTSVYYSRKDSMSSSAHLINPVMREITSNYVFSIPFYDAGISDDYGEFGQSYLEEIRSDMQLRAAIAELRHRFDTSSEVLSHGDLHTGSIMVYNNDVKLIDCEFGFYGPIGFDLGMLIANLIMSAASQEHDSTKIDVFDSIAELYYLTIESFEKDWVNASIEDKHISNLLLRQQLERFSKDVKQFAGIEILRRVLGVAKVEDLTRYSGEKRFQLDDQLVRFGRQLLINHDKVDLSIPILRN